MAKFLFLLVLISSTAYGRPKDEASNKDAVAESVGIANSVDVSTDKEVKADQKTEICQSKDCVEASYRLFQQMDLTADPCKDFSQFSCGSYYQNTVIPDDKTAVTAFTPLRDEIDRRGWALLKGEKQDDDFESFGLARDYFKSCMNVEHQEKIGREPIEKLVNELGGWPVVEGDKWNNPDFKWYEQDVMKSKMGLGYGYIISLYPSTDDRNNSWRAYHMDQPGLGMSREYLVQGFDDEDVQHYYQYILDTAEYMGADRDKAEKELKEMLEFEIKLANLTAPREERRDKNKLYNPTTLGNLTRLPGHPPSWTKYLQDLVAPFEDEELQLNINDEEKVIVQNPGFVTNVTKLLNETDARVIANYYGWRTVKSFMNHLDNKARNIAFKYAKARTGLKSLKPTWKRCVGETGVNVLSSGGLGIPAGVMYLKKHFRPEDKGVLLDMIDHLKGAFDKMLDENEWMDEDTVKNAKLKLNSMINFIGYPEEMLDREKIDGLFKGLEISPKDFVGNELALSKFWTKWHYGRVRQKIDPMAWFEHQFVTNVNAFYFGTINALDFPAGIMQGAFFNSKVPNYMNYGAIGMVIGHEITHGFDDQGRRRDHKGALVDWWDEETGKEYVKRAQCVVDQYNNYTVKQVGVNLNGINGQGENIADIGGLKEAYIAYEKWAKDKQAEPSLPGFGNYTPKQMFWISFGQIWCQTYRDAALESAIKTGTHSPGMYRIIGAVSNNKHFAEDFNCPAGSPMNPEKKCVVW